eukprot:14927482-Ditylum_brightwellii.AAC.1
MNYTTTEKELGLTAIAPCFFTSHWDSGLKPWDPGKWRNNAHFRLYRCSGVGDGGYLHAGTVRLFSRQDVDEVRETVLVMYGPSESFYVAKVIERKCGVGTYDENFWTYLLCPGPTS